MNVLIIDDDAEILFEKFEKEFKADSIQLSLCRSRDEALEFFKRGCIWDAIILDWYLDADDSTYSKLILKDLEKVQFVPVLIWSQHIDDYNATKENGEISYPLNLIYELSKLDEDRKKVSQILKEWVKNNLAAKISKVYRRSIHGNLEKTFFELNAIPNSHLAIVLKTVVGNEQNIDWTSDLILNLIHRFLLVDTQFVDDFGSLLQEIVIPNSNEIGDVDKRSLINKILYFQPKSNFIRNGDIIRIKSADDKINILATIVTPDCDLVQGTTRFLEMVELRSIDDEVIKLKDQHKENIRKNNHPSFHYFPSVKIDGDFFDLIAVLKSKIILEETADFTEIKYPAASKRLLYSHRFLFHHMEVQLELICGKSNPYKSDFLQKLFANNSRVGIPDIKNLFN